MSNQSIHHAYLFSTSAMRPHLTSLFPSCLSPNARTAASKKMDLSNGGSSSSGGVVDGLSSLKTSDVRVERMRAEIFSLTYGSLVTQLIRDYEDIEEVNGKLREIGRSIGVRLIDEFLAKSGTMRCKTFKETAETVGSVGFKMYLGTLRYIRLTLCPYRSPTRRRRRRLHRIQSGRMRLEQGGNGV